MAEFPAMPFWTDAYLADTTHLTTIEHGAYLLLLIAMWRAKDNRLPSDDAKLARYAKLTAGQWRRIKPTIMEFFRDDGTWITQGRLTDEAAFVRRTSARQSDNAQARWRKNKETHDATALPEQSRAGAPTPTPTPTPIESPSQPSSLVLGCAEIHPRYQEVMGKLEAMLNSPSSTHWSLVNTWLISGCDPDLDIYPTVERLKPKWRGRSLTFFTDAIADARATRTTPMPAGQSTASGPSLSQRLEAHFNKKKAAAE
jgi:uncharacterized protein YdaU (DUF1376 family)